MKPKRSPFELDAKGDVIGIEILGASKFFRPIAKPLYRQMQGLLIALIDRGKRCGMSDW